jgi:hypothetical protein
MSDGRPGVNSARREAIESTVSRACLHEMVGASAAYADSTIMLSAIICYTFAIETNEIFAMDTRREAALQRQIEKVKANLGKLGDLRPGSLSTQYNVCGSPGCRCKATPPVKHGPYYQVSYSRKGKSSSKFVKKEDLPAVTKQLKNYERMKLLMDLWIDLATELSNLRLVKDSG